MGPNDRIVRLSERAYNALARRKREDESFSEAAERLAAECPISDLDGVFTDDEVESIRSARADAYSSYSEDLSER